MNRPLQSSAPTCRQAPQTVRTSRRRTPLPGEETGARDDRPTQSAMPWRKNRMSGGKPTGGQADRAVPERPIDARAGRSPCNVRGIAPVPCLLWPTWRNRAARGEARKFNHKCTLMHADGPESGMIVHGRDPSTGPHEPRRCGGPCLIRVHQRASAVELFAACRTPPPGWPITACKPEPLYNVSACRVA